MFWQLPQVAATKKSALKCKTWTEIAKMSTTKLAPKHAEAQARLRAARVKAAENVAEKVVKRWPRKT